MTRKELLESGLAALRALGVDYGDLRRVERRAESLTVRNGLLEPASRSVDRGIGVRVVWHGAWGFAATSTETEEAVRRAAERAVQVARASAQAGGEKAALVPVEPARGTYRTEIVEDPFAVPLSEKIDLLVRSVEAMRAKPDVVAAEASCDAFRTRKHFLSTEGTDVEQDVVVVGAGIAATCEAAGDVQRRSYPNSFRGNFRAAGYEFVRGLDLLGNAPRVAEEAAALCRAPECPAGETTVVLDADQMALQVHESCGHPTELDRVLGTEISLAGGSFMGLDGLGKLRYGSEIVNLTADSTVPGGLGTFGWDDEGVPATRTPLVAKGIHVGYLTSRETAARAGLPRSGATMRAESWSHLPLIRMVNVNLEPGEGTLAEILSEVQDGIYIATNKAWSIDDLRLNFQFGCEVAWEVKRGKRTRLMKNPVYTGSTPAFWGRCTAVGGPEDWVLTGLTTCGKGDPMQGMAVGHGAPPARFEGVRVGSGR